MQRCIQLQLKRSLAPLYPFDTPPVSVCVCASVQLGPFVLSSSCPRSATLTAHSTQHRVPSPPPVCSWRRLLTSRYHIMNINTTLVYVAYLQAAAAAPRPGPGPARSSHSHSHSHENNFPISKTLCVSSFGLLGWGPLWGGVASSCCQSCGSNFDFYVDFEFDFNSEFDSSSVSCAAQLHLNWLHESINCSRSIAAALELCSVPPLGDRHDRSSKIPGIDLVDLLPAALQPGGGTLTTCLPKLSVVHLPIWLWPRLCTASPHHHPFHSCSTRSLPDCCRLLQLLRVVAFMS